MTAADRSVAFGLPVAGPRRMAAALAVALHLAAAGLLLAGGAPRAAREAVPPASLPLVHAGIVTPTAPAPTAPAPAAPAPAAPVPVPRAAAQPPAAAATPPVRPRVPRSEPRRPDALPAEPLLPSGTAAPSAASTAAPEWAEPQPAAPPAAVAQAVAAVPAMATTAPPEPAAELVAARPDHAHCPRADYPLLLRDHKVQGTVLLRVRVEADGSAGEVQVLRGSGWRLFDEAASRSVRACRFVPARRGGERLASWVEFPVRFALNDG